MSFQNRRQGRAGWAILLCRTIYAVKEGPSAEEFLLARYAGAASTSISGAAIDRVPGTRKSFHKNYDDEQILIVTGRNGTKRIRSGRNLQKIAHGEADHAPSPLPEGMDKLVNQITVKRFGVKREISEIRKGEADHAPSPLPEGMDKLVNQISVKRFGVKREISEIRKGEADHAPSPLQQGKDKLVNQITVKRFGAKRQEFISNSEGRGRPRAEPGAARHP